MNDRRQKHHTEPRMRNPFGNCFKLHTTYLHTITLSPTGYQKRTRPFSRELHVYSLDNFVAF